MRAVHGSPMMATVQLHYASVKTAIGTKKLRNLTFSFMIEPRV